MSSDGARCYRTGDLVRRRGDGNLEFLGRTDAQVKVRGHRIELGEIEHALSAQSGVASAAVILRRDADVPARLVAYVVARDAALDTVRLRVALAERLPDFMVPSVIVLLGELPRLPSGKVDRRALPPPPVRSGVSPRTLTEERLSALWRVLLGVERVGSDDNFFELGGHSLVAMQLVSRVRNRFGVDIPLSSVFDAPTLDAFARVIDTAMNAVPEAC